MEYYGQPGSKNSTLHGMVFPSGSSYRVYNLHFSVTATTTPASALLYLCNPSNTVYATSTAPTQSTIYVTVSYDAAKPVGVGYWESHEGVYFPDGLFIQTPSNLKYYTMVYSPVSKN